MHILQLANLLTEFTNKLLIFFLVNKYVFTVKEFSVKKMSSKSNTIDGRFLGTAVEALWERAQKGVRGKKFKPDAALHVDGNIVPDDLKPFMKDATWKKIMYNYTGPDPLEHEHESKLVKRILQNAKELHKVNQS